MSIMKTRSCGNAPGLPAVWVESALPAPLPSLTSALSRRAAIFGVVTATGFLGAAGATALGKGDTVTARVPVLDPADARLVEIHRTSTELQARFDHYDVVDEDAGAAYDKVADMRVEAFDLRATTPAGALASLQLARAEFARYYVDVADPDWLDRWTLAMIDNAIAVLRTEVIDG